jgi:diaminopimelate epimerase
MQRKLIVEFTKMNGAGNDFIVIDNRFFHFRPDELADLARRWCPRRTGIGADGLLALTVSETPGLDARMLYLNADGSRAAMCGNGARCLARYARQAGLGGKELLLETDAGVFRALVPDDADAPVRLFGHTVRDWNPDITLQGGTEVDGSLAYLWTGTEHTVCFVPDVDAAPVAETGPHIRQDPALQPAGANVNYVEVRTPGDSQHAAVLTVRTYEKGVEGETLACGTGAVAAAVAAWRAGRIERQTVDVQMPGGTLTVGFEATEDDIQDVYLEGPADFVYRGTVEV